MNQKEMRRVMLKVFSETDALRDAGQAEYAHEDSNAFRNFESVGEYLDLDRRKVLLTYAIKHMDGITSFVKGHESQREDVRGRINDLIVYMMLLRGMIDEDEDVDVSDYVPEIAEWLQDFDNQKPAE